MPNTLSLETVLADWQSKATTLRSTNALVPADTIDDFAREVRRAAEPYLTFLDEADAMLYSGQTREWLRRRFARWEREGHARRHPMRRRERQYRMLVLPRRLDVSAVQEDARAAARAADAAAMNAAARSALDGRKVS